MRIVITIIFFLICATVSYSGDASLSGTSYSIMVDDSLMYMDGYQVDALFTTYDGNRYAYPYYFDSNEGYIYYSKELKKNGNFYYMDYYNLSMGTIYDFGEISLNLGSIDFNINGIDDICEIDKSINVNISGNWYSSDGSSGSIGGTMIRNANIHKGNYNLVINNTLAGNIPATGEFYIGVLSGNISYSTSSSEVTFNYSTIWETQQPSDPVQTTFEIIDADTVKVNGIDFFPTTAFIRNGNKYSATVLLSDGGFDTFWPDYQKWHIVIQDLNDSDGDGIPDLSDPPEPGSEPKSMPWVPLLLLDD